MGGKTHSDEEDLETDSDVIIETSFDGEDDDTWSTAYGEIESIEDGSENSTESKIIETATCESREQSEKKCHAHTTEPEPFIVEFAWEQFVQRESELSSHTVMHVELYKRYCNRKSRKKHSINRIWRGMKRFKPSRVTHGKDSYDAYGPLKLRLMVNGTQQITGVYVTEDKRIKNRILLGKEFKDRIPARWHKPGEYPTFDTDQHGHTNAKFLTSTGERTANILLDTGAGPTLMSEEMWKELEPNLELFPCNRKLRGITAGNLEALGYTPPLRVQLGMTEVMVSFIVVRNVSKDEIILGRDFIRSHHVLVDLTEGYCKIMDPAGKSIYREKTVIDESKPVRIVQMVDSTEIEPATIQRVRMSNPSWKNQEGKQVIIGARTPRGGVVAPGRTRTVIRDGVVQASVLNVNDDKVCRVRTGENVAYAYAVRTIYERKRNNGCEHCERKLQEQSEQVLLVDDDDASGCHSLESMSDFPLVYEDGRYQVKPPELEEIQLPSMDHLEG